jgi:Ran GTPase-activating protein (RanGAP) involved in mRNA processing and transport
VGGNCIGNEGLINICKGLKTNRTLESLSLQSNDINHHGCDVIKDVIPKTKIFYLDISKNNLGNAGAEKIAWLL